MVCIDTSTHPMTTSTTKPPAKQRGGARTGTGPKPADGAKDVKRVNITIDPKSDQIAHEIGEGDRSLGIRRALATAKDHQDKSAGSQKTVRTQVRGTQSLRTANQSGQESKGKL